MKKVLLIDDSTTQLVSLKMLVQKAGYSVITANNGVEGISSVYENFPDIIVSDIVMPEINGYQLCRLLKNDLITKNIPIILLTSLNERIDEFWALKAGAEAFINKDKDIDKLVNEIEATLIKYSEMPINNGDKVKPETGFEQKTLQHKINQILDQSLKETTIINEFKKFSEYISDTHALNKTIFSLLTEIIDYNIAGVFFNDIDDKKDKILYLSLNGIEENDSLKEHVRREVFSTFFERDFQRTDALCNCEILEKSDAKEEKLLINDFSSKTVVPITYLSRVIGGICLYHVQPEKYSNSRIFNIITEELKILMRLKWLHSETKYLAITDSLTGLYNRRYFQQALEREVARSRRYKTDLSLVMIDIDHFKNINDTYGHQFGDKVLAEIASLFKNKLRKTDYMSRYGGEEFAAILPETNLKNAIIPFERIRQSVENIDFKYGDKSVKITVSIGVSSYNDKVQGETELIAGADEALYRAKNNGRNRIEF